jgi:hypothetical protein
VNDLDFDRVLGAFEAEHPAGTTSAEVIAILRRHGVRFTEATLRKYVQLGLLPRSRRVGAKGKHQGSWGVYPAWTARQVVTVKSLLAQGRTIEQISDGMLGIMVDCLGIATDIGEVRANLVRLEKAGSGDPEGIRDIRDLMSAAARSVERAADIAREGRDMVEIAI